MKKLLLFTLFMLFGANLWAGGILVSWNANSEPDIAGYKVYYAPSSEWTFNAGTNLFDHNGTWPQVFDAGNNTSFVIENTGVGPQAVFVTAYNTKGAESGPSDTVELFTQAMEYPTARSIGASSVPAGVKAEPQE